MAQKCLLVYSSSVVSDLEFSITVNRVELRYQLYVGFTSMLFLRLDQALQLEKATKLALRS